MIESQRAVSIPYFCRCEQALSFSCVRCVLHPSCRACGGASRTYSFIYCANLSVDPSFAILSFLCGISYYRRRVWRCVTHTHTPVSARSVLAHPHVRTNEMSSLVQLTLRCNRCQQSSAPSTHTPEDEVPAPDM